MGGGQPAGAGPSAGMGPMGAGPSAAGAPGGSRSAGHPRHPAHAAPRNGRPCWIWVVAGLAAVSALAGGILAAVPRSAPAASHLAVVASLPYWSIGQVGPDVTANRRDFTEASPWMYGLTSAGRITLQYPGSQAAAVQGQIALLRKAGLAIVPTLADVTAGRWNTAPVARMLHDPALMRAQVAAIAALVRERRYAGIDIDYENLAAGDRQGFSAFVTALAATLHAEGKILSVSVFAKTSNAGVDPQDEAQNYAAIGRAADQVRVMAYDYHWDTSPPGPVAPIAWVRSVLRYAETQIPASKVILGIPVAGYDWSAGHGSPVSWQGVQQLARRYGVAAHFAAGSQSPWLSYSAAGASHVVWFEDQASTRAKLSAARAMGAGGVFLWMYGPPDPGTWGVLGDTLPVADASRPRTAGGL